jgi:hypothetical protein
LIASIHGVGESRELGQIATTAIALGQLNPARSSLGISEIEKGGHHVEWQQHVLGVVCESLHPPADAGSVSIPHEVQFTQQELR